MRTLRSSLRRLFPAHVARMSHHHLLSQLAQPPAYPRRMHSRFQRHPAARHSPEQFSHGVGVVLTFGSTPTSPVASRTQYQLDRSPRSSVVGLQSFHLPCCCSADLLHRRSPLSLAPSSASITCEPTASRLSPASSSHLFATVLSNNPESCRGGVECWSLLPYLRPSDRGQNMRYFICLLGCILPLSERDPCPKPV
jgi:hypothetical protein